MILQVKDVVSGYGDMDILHGISIEVNQGEIVSIVGPNGSGKSTTLKTIFGLVNLKQGEVLYYGDSINQNTPDQLVGLGLSFVPQSDNVFPSLTVHENLEMGAFISKTNKKYRFDLIYDLFPPLKEKRKTQAGNLSGGQRQMVAFGRALIMEPELLLLDEPTAGLSPLYIDMILEKVAEINKETGVSVLMVEQNAKKALKMSDRGYVLAAGQKKYEDTGQALLNNEEVAQLFLGG
ncbi:amino acid/amide ABC transporter ATP-binding protein 2 (HAAT family) [Orenia metallireducens]|jgi:branched-chain amino acid transport system ATP-binding protein|uniref:Amino acid/amide ABC transporter ATP-binding protein 2, HAAT family n=1 Tax=Orenia metallireducens TaxID=1413210 RepID=A0A285HYK2_9FIRM|nr:ABC transporter ATP-binding protein [Orenia metallireducens]PRX29291.1 amino acid/amide ABC transporter ATP-binding protein 2 (HAAT family) [Orenia metallireducens]SNY40723.1 amino acid/amide ABC transporter ATP-binding protein 2, HAAT family [Orenia metallireducens]